MPVFDTIKQSTAAIAAGKKSHPAKRRTPKPPAFREDQRQVLSNKMAMLVWKLTSLQNSLTSPRDARNADMNISVLASAQIAKLQPVLVRARALKQRIDKFPSNSPPPTAAWRAQMTTFETAHSMANTEYKRLDQQLQGRISTNGKEAEDKIQIAHKVGTGAKIIGSAALGVATGGVSAGYQIAAGAAYGAATGLAGSVSEQHHYDGEVALGRTAKDTVIGGVVGGVSAGIGYQAGAAAAARGATQLQSGAVSQVAGVAADELMTRKKAPSN